VFKHPLRIAEVSYERGFGTHAPTRMVYAMDGTYRRFQASVGQDDEENGTVTFEVWVDGQKQWESGLMRRGDAARTVDIDISRARRLELVAGGGDDSIEADHADWVDAQLTR